MEVGQAIHDQDAVMRSPIAYVAGHDDTILPLRVACRKDSREAVDLFVEDSIEE